MKTIPTHRMQPPPPNRAITYQGSDDPEQPADPARDPHAARRVAGRAPVPTEEPTEPPADEAGEEAEEKGRGRKAKKND